MSGSATITGGNGASPSAVTVPLAFNEAVIGDLQSTFAVWSDSIKSGGGFYNFDQASGVVSYEQASSNSVFEITNTDGSGIVTSGESSGSYTIGSAYTGLVVQAPGYETVQGSPTTDIAVFGQESNVLYKVAGGAGSIFASGGSDTVAVGSVNSSGAYVINSAGNDHVTLYSGANTVTAIGSASTSATVANSADTISALNNATISVLFMEYSGGTVDFVNGTDQQASIFSGFYTVPGPSGPVKQYADNAVTAFGGNGGGIYVGGNGGNNSLVGGNGTVTLIGGNSGDVLSVTGGGLNGTTNEIFSGQGAETLGASSSSGSNTFQLNYFYDGVGTITGNDLVSTTGQGQQAFILGAGDSTITGSTVGGATNIFDLVRSDTLGSANYLITNFASIHGVMYVTSPNLATGNSSIASITTQSFAGVPVTSVILTDQTTVRFDDVLSSQLMISTSSDTGIISINYS